MTYHGPAVEDTYRKAYGGPVPLFDPFPLLELAALILGAVYVFIALTKRF